MIYLASPYSHPDPAVREDRFRAACLAAAALLRQGHAVFSPIAHSHCVATVGDLDPSWALWRAGDLRLLEACDELVVLRLDGWDRSVGVTEEVAYARSRGTPVAYLDPDHG